MSFDPGLERHALSDEQRRWLGDPARDRTSALSPLAGLHVAAIEITGLELEDSWSTAWFEGVTLVGCTFYGHDFSDARFTSVTFERCRLEGCQLDGAIFEACSFRDCELLESTVRSASLHDCKFVSSVLEGLMLYEVRFDGVRMERGALKHVRLSECMLHFWQLAETTIETVRLTLCQAGRVEATDCTIDHLSILGGSYGVLDLSEGALSDFLVAGARVETLLFAELSSASRVRVNESQVRALSLTRCEISDLYIWQSALKRLQIAEGAYEGSVIECTLGAGSRIEDAALRSFFWDESVATDLTFSRVLFQRFLCARGARFVGLRIELARFTEGFELDLAGAAFEQGDAFALPTLTDPGSS